MVKSNQIKSNQIVSFTLAEKLNYNEQNMYMHLREFSIECLPLGGHHLVNRC